MKQEEIVNEIRRMCGQTIPTPSLGWHFKYKEQVYIYVVGKDESMIRFCIPFVAGLLSNDKELLKEAVNETNRNVKYIKVLLSEKKESKYPYLAEYALEGGMSMYGGLKVLFVGENKAIVIKNSPSLYKTFRVGGDADGFCEYKFTKISSEEL